MTTKRTAAGGWSDLPDDILGNIRLKITSLRDRVRLATVCMPWRAAAARLPALPAAPLLLMSPRSMTGLTKQLCGGGPGDGWVLRLRYKAADRFLIMGSHEGGWITTSDHLTRKLMLINLFSRSELEVCYPWQEDLRCVLSPLCQVILSGDPASSTGCILAAIACDLRKITLGKVGRRSGWTEHGFERRIFVDIAFCNGDLYGLTYPDEELVRFQIRTGEDGSPMVTSTHKMAVRRRQGPIAYDRYIVEPHGRPTMAIRTKWVPNLEPFFKVFELVDADTSEAAYQHDWAEVTSFGGYALFLGPVNSMAVHVPVGAERRGFERNHVYYSDAAGSREDNYLRGDEVYSLRLDDGRLMYCREDQNIGDGIGRTGYYLTGCENAFMWLQPPDL